MTVLYPLREEMHEQNNSFNFFMVKSEYCIYYPHKGDRCSDQEGRVCIQTVDCNILTLFLTSMKWKQDFFCKKYNRLLCFFGLLQRKRCYLIIVTIGNASIKWTSFGIKNNTFLNRSSIWRTVESYSKLNHKFRSQWSRLLMWYS